MLPAAWARRRCKLRFQQLVGLYSEDNQATEGDARMARAQTIQIYLPSGNPSGIRIANLTTRTVRMFEIPRPLLREFLERQESRQVGWDCPEFS